MMKNTLIAKIVTVLGVIFFFIAGGVPAGEDHGGHRHDEEASVAHQEKKDEAPHEEEHDHNAHDEAKEKKDHLHDEDGHDDAGHEDAHHGHEGHDEEGLVLSLAQRKEIGLKTAVAGPAELNGELTLMGEIRLNENQVAHVVPRVAGVVRRVEVSMGVRVKKGDLLGVIESAELAEAKADYLEKHRMVELTNKSYDRKKYLRRENIASEADLLEKEAEFLSAEIALKTARRKLTVLGLAEREVQELPKAKDAEFGIHGLTAPISGTIIEKHLTMGEKVNDDTEIFTIADLNTLWADFQVPTRDIPSVAVGMKVLIESAAEERTEAEISLIGPIVDPGTRTALARVVLDNADGRWRPGVFVTGHIRLSEKGVSVMVPVEAVQGIEGKNVVFVQADDAFVVVPVVLGRRDRTGVEIISGLKPGTTYVSSGAFELKAMMITSSLGSHAGHGH